MAPFPTDPSFPLRSERYWFRSIILASICYGISFALYLVCAHLLISRITGWKKPKPVQIIAPTRRGDIFSLLYITFIFACCTTSILVEGISGENAYVDFRGVAGGPSKYLFDHTFTNVTTLRAAYISFLLCHWAATGIMNWRCLVIYKYTGGGRIVNRGIPRWVLWMTVPLVLFLASIATGIIFLVQAISPSRLPESIGSMRWPLIWGGIAVPLQCILTGMVTVRLLAQRKHIRKAMGKEYCSKFTGIVAMLVESSCLLSCFSVFYIVTYALESPLMVMLPFVLTQVQVIAPLLVMYRVTSGRAWSQHAISDLGRTSPFQTFQSHEGQATTDSTLHQASSSGAILSRYQETTLTADATENDGSKFGEHWISVADQKIPKKGLDGGVTSEELGIIQCRDHYTAERQGIRNSV